MRKFISALVLGAALLFGGSLDAQAEHVGIVGSTFTAVGVSSSLTTFATRGVTVNVHVNGTYDVTLNLEREVGSPGSGAFEVVMRDIAPAANGLHRIVWTTQKDNEVLRLAVSTFTSGTVVYSLFDGRNTPRVFGITGFNRRTHINRFEEFNQEHLAIAADADNGLEWVTFTDLDGTVWADVAGDNEGAISGTAGTSDSNDVSAASFEIVTNDGGLVSDGLMVIEFRTSMDDITEVEGYLGLSDVIAVSAATIPFTVNSNVVADIGSTDEIGFIFSSDATDTNSWQPVSTNSGAVGNNAVEFACDFRDAVNDEYDILRIEIEATGDAFWYVGGVLCAAEALAVATDTVFVGYLAVDNNIDDATGGGVLTVEYLDYYYARTSN